MFSQIFKVFLPYCLMTRFRQQKIIDLSFIISILSLSSLSSGHVHSKTAVPRDDN